MSNNIKAGSVTFLQSDLKTDNSIYELDKFIQAVGINCAYQSGIYDTVTNPYLKKLTIKHFYTLPRFRVDLSYYMYIAITRGNATANAFIIDKIDMNAVYKSVPARYDFTKTASATTMTLAITGLDDNTGNTRSFVTGDKIIVTKCTDDSIVENTIATVTVTAGVATIPCISTTSTEGKVNCYYVVSNGGNYYFDVNSVNDASLNKHNIELGYSFFGECGNNLDVFGGGTLTNNKSHIDNNFFISLALDTPNYFPSDFSSIQLDAELLYSDDISNVFTEMRVLNNINGTISHALDSVYDTIFKVKSTINHTSSVPQHGGTIGIVEYQNSSYPNKYYETGRIEVPLYTSLLHGYSGNKQLSLTDGCVVRYPFAYSSTTHKNFCTTMLFIKKYGAL